MKDSCLPCTLMLPGARSGAETEKQQGGRQVDGTGHANIALCQDPQECCRALEKLQARILSLRGDKRGCREERGVKGSFIFVAVAISEVLDFQSLQLN